MPVVSRPEEFNVADLFIDLGPAMGRSLYLKCEGFNFAGSIKIKAAVEMVASAMRQGLVRPGSRLVESSSGNLAIALSVVASSQGLRFVCVTDSRCTEGARRCMSALGTEVVVVTEPHPQHGLLGARLECVRRICEEDRDAVWLNQYANQGNWRAHYQSTGVEIVKEFPAVDVLFLGVGTGGTLMGTARYIREHVPSARIVAVDAVGSVAFGGPAARRMIPGLGMSVRPELLDPSIAADVVLVPEPDTVRTCLALARKGFVLGGSSGTVVGGALRWLALHHPDDEITAVAVSPDLGDRYLDTIYREQRVSQTYGDLHATSAPPTHTVRRRRDR